LPARATWRGPGGSRGLARLPCPRGGEAARQYHGLPLSGGLGEASAEVIAKAARTEAEIPGAGRTCWRERIRTMPEAENREGLEAGRRGVVSTPPGSAWPWPARSTPGRERAVGPAPGSRLPPAGRPRPRPAHIATFSPAVAMAVQAAWSSPGPPAVLGLQQGPDASPPAVRLGHRHVGRGPGPLGERLPAGRDRPPAISGSWHCRPPSRRTRRSRPAWSFAATASRMVARLSGPAAGLATGERHSPPPARA
jgi:hypothetical protein